MVSSRHVWIALVLFLTCDSGVLGRAVVTRDFPFKSLAPTRWRRGAADLQRERCAELAAPWQENSEPAPEDDNPATLLQLRVRPFSPMAPSQGLLFPGKSLFRFVRRVYRCCQEQRSCGSVRGIPGRRRADSRVEFLLSRDVLSLTLIRAELHLQLSNPQHQDIRPLVLAAAKQGVPTRYSLWSYGDTAELRVDLLSFLQRLQAATGSARGVPHSGRVWEVAMNPQDADGATWSDGGLDLGLVLDCGQAGSKVTCGASGVHLTHTPFVVVYYG